MSAYRDAVIGASAFNPANFGQVVFTPESNYYDGQTNSQILNNAYTQSALAYDMYMSNTSYQRAVNDLKSAGLNPYLVMSGGNGASGGSMSAFQRANGQNTLSPEQKELNQIAVNSALTSLEQQKVALKQAKLDYKSSKADAIVRQISAVLTLGGSELGSALSNSGSSFSGSNLTNLF